MMIAPIDRKIPWPPKPVTNTDVIDRALHGMLDTDGNGKVAKDEWNRAGRDDASFALFDANKDGSVSEDEFAKTRKYEREFNEKDKNGSGVLGRLEFEAKKFINHLGGGILHKFEAGEKAIDGAKDLMLRCVPPFFRDRFASFDKDRDGTVSKEEYVAGRRREESVIRPTPWNPPIYKLAAAEAKVASNG